MCAGTQVNNMRWLAALGRRLRKLEMPAVLDIGTTITAACQELPWLRFLVLHCHENTCMGYLQGPNSSASNSGESSSEDPYAWLANARLSHLTLSVPPGHVPLCFYEDQGPLHLSLLPAFQHLRLQGPIVRDAGGVPFELPPKAKVCV